MYGLEAISANNGWAMALAGGLIVMSGLCILSFVISQIHKILALWEKLWTGRDNNKLPQKDEVTDEQDVSIPDPLPGDINKTAHYYAPLIEQLGEAFQLAELYKITQEKNFPHPHLTITQFQQADILVPRGDGFFTWNPQK